MMPHIASRNGLRIRVAPLCRWRGFTLVELMVSIAIGFVITLAVLAVFLNVSRSNREMVKTNDQVDAARAAMQVLKEDIIHAGFWGAYVPQFDDVTVPGVPGDVPTAVPNPCLAYSVANWDTTYVNGLLGIPVESYDPADVTFNCSGIVLNRQANTDILVVRHAATCALGETGCAAAVTNALYFQASLCDNELNAVPPLRYVLAQMPASAPDTVYPLKKRGCTGIPPAATSGTFADKRKFTSSIYYIRDYANTVGDGIPTLMRAQFNLSGTTPAFGAAVPLIQGLQGFRVELGIDSLSKTGAAVNYNVATNWTDPTNMNSATNRGDGIPDGDYVRCSSLVPCTAAQLRDVVTVRIHLLARADSPSPGYNDDKTYNLGSTTLGPFNDSYKRHVFSTTIRIQNVSGRRELP